MMPFLDVVNSVIRNGIYYNKLHCNEYHGTPWVIGAQYVNLDDEREMATIRGILRSKMGLPRKL